jgi:predicted RNA-binding Zn-ribbon protein involved in translation (DUF1610 family)
MSNRKLSFWEYWFDSPKDPLYQETVDEEIASLVSPRIRRTAEAACGMLEIMQEKPMNEQRCPKCGHHSFRRVKDSEKENPDDSNWRCVRCGNDTDEFGNKL